ncbi:hypothetical protein CROQUDRAFT_549527 [Cronartium quercuum f. sp. fusiforme G11]|uniref:polynucleotide adenylyltransferase n=1 Tax=Cronartium quercuum f. sp. fusiforme G11 TaxID=708437 RepID=A0A9P6NLS9_9BASI|nr:hypothetical protein CROQUDRAFT_549527 [Cronartium quercuum f. sp. fusiforme G11]
MSSLHPPACMTSLRRLKPMHCLPTSEVLAARLRIIRSINRALNQSRLTQQPKPFKVVAFGSTTFGLDSSESDLDLCILDPHLPRGPRKPSELRTSGVYSMYTLAQILRTLSFTHILPIQTANVPIVKFRSPDQLIAGDLNTNHALGVYNSALLRAYRDIAPGLFRPLGMAIKLWAKARGLCDPSGATGPPSASAYTLILMLVSYLQEVGQLPNLQDERAIAEIGRRSSFFTFPVKRCHRKTRKQKQAGAEEHDTSFAPRPVEAWAPKQEAVLEELFVGFFAYYARFNFAGLVISIRNGGPCERRKAAGTSSSSKYSPDSKEGEKLQGSLETKTKKQKRKKNRRHLSTLIPPGAPDYYGWEEPMAVEDPFIRSRNTCKNIGRSTVRKMKSELLRAQEIIEAGGGLLELCGVGQVDGSDLDSNSEFTSLATSINTPNKKVVKQVRVAGASDGSQTRLITESDAKRKKARGIPKSKKAKQLKPKALAGPNSSQPKLTDVKKVKSKLVQSNLRDTLELERKFQKKKTEEFWQEFRARGKAKVQAREKAILESRTEPNEVENIVLVSP